jgi:hypothetical protein
MDKISNNHETPPIANVLLCAVCRSRSAEKNSIVCSDKCNEIRLRIIKLTSKYTPTNGCDNCWGDLHQGCTNKCKEEFKVAGEFVKELYELVRVS